MRTPFISIDIPVYNMADYVGECLDSILSQSFSDWEVICTDDGSTDETGRILDEYAAKDSRIRVIHQGNRGVSIARNVAMDASQGEWLWFVDPDDVLLSGALARIHELVAINNCDAIYFSKFTSFDERCDESVKGKGDYILKMSSPDTGKALLFQNKRLQGQPFLRVLRREKFGTVRYPDGVIYLEDSINMIDILSVKAKWVYVDESVYGYRYRLGSVSHGYRKGKCELVLESFADIFRRSREKLGLTDDEYHKFVQQSSGAARYYMTLAFKSENREGLKRISIAYNQFRRITGERFLNRFWCVRCRLAGLGLYGVLSWGVRIMEWLYFGCRKKLGFSVDD